MHPIVTTIPGTADTVATDDSGNVYVSSGGMVSKFDSAGNPVDFSAFGSNTIVAAGTGIAVDNSGGVTRGDIYVSGAGFIRIYAASGALLGTIQRGAFDSALSNTCGVAVDPSGKLYVNEQSDGGGLDRYVPSTNPASDVDYNSKVDQLANGCSLAADSAGAVYRPADTGGALKKYTAGQFGSSVAGTTFATGARAVAVDPANDDVYVARAADIAVYDRHGNPRGSFGSGQVTNPTGIAVDESGNVFVANGVGTVVFGPALVFPDVTTATADAITTSAATLHGKVNPQGLTVSDCQFEYGTDSSYGDSAPCAEAVGAGSSPVDVSAAVSGLDPETTYHFRLVATNANGASEAADQSFDTAGKPGISGTTAGESGVDRTVVKAKINPHFAATTYRVEYGPDTSYGSSTPESAPVGTDGATHAVAATLAGLDPDSIYHFRFVATNSSGTTEGPDTTLRTCLTNRTGASADLPDCRAYEQVSPLDKGGRDVGRLQGLLSSPDGSAAVFASTESYPGAQSSPYVGAYAAARDSSSWQTAGVSPPVASQYTGASTGAIIYGGTPDFSGMLVRTRNALTPDAVEGGINDYYEDVATGTYRLIRTGGALQWAGASPDGQHLFFSHSGLLATTPAPAPGTTRNLYDFSPTGNIGLVGLLPDGSPDPAGSVQAGATKAVAKHAVSVDGSRVYWTEATAGPHPVYLREGGETFVVSRDQFDAAKNATFEYATRDGSKALVSSSTPLTDDASPTGTDLYSYDADADELTDLTPGNATGSGVIGAFGSSDDGSHVYFLATGALAPGATAGNPNIYVWHGGTTRFLGALGSNAADITTDFANGIGNKWGVSPDGLGFGLLFKGAVSGPHPQPAQTFRQAYYYSYPDDSLACASCPPDGSPPAGGASFGPGASGTFFPDPQVLAAYVGSQIAVTDGGRIFFETATALVSADVNSQTPCRLDSADHGSCSDVYEWRDGAPHLITPGRGSASTGFGTATPSGDDVFFFTRDRLVGQDQDDNVDAYTAHVNGGISAQNPPPGTGDCVGEACQGPPNAPPAEQSPGSSGYSGSGNQGKERTAPSDSPPNQTRSKCSKKKSKKARKKCKKKGRKRSRTANTNRRAGN